jgi:hypothetical protein
VLVVQRNLSERVGELQGGYFLATGIWPLVSRRTFEALTGTKGDYWLAQTVGVLVSCIGGVLLTADRRKRLTPELEALGASSAAALALVDLVFVLRGRIRRTYLLDAALETALAAGWVARRRLHMREEGFDGRGAG